MKRYTIDAAKEAPERFIAAVDAMKEREETDDCFRISLGTGVGFKETAAIRRASLDLTRALGRNEEAMTRPGFIRAVLRDGLAVAMLFAAGWGLFVIAGVLQ